MSGSSTPGTLVFARMKGYPPWPARYAKRSEASHEVLIGETPGRVLIHFFGTHDFAWMTPNALSTWNDKPFRIQNANISKITYNDLLKAQKEARRWATLAPSDRVFLYSNQRYDDQADEADVDYEDDRGDDVNLCKTEEEGLASPAIRDSPPSTAKHSRPESAATMRMRCSISTANAHGKKGGAKQRSLGTIAAPAGQGHSPLAPTAEPVAHTPSGKGTRCVLSNAEFTAPDTAATRLDEEGKAPTAHADHAAACRGRDMENGAAKCRNRKTIPKPTEGDMRGPGAPNPGSMESLPTVDSSATRRPLTSGAVDTLAVESLGLAESEEGRGRDLMEDLPGCDAYRVSTPPSIPGSRSTVLELGEMKPGERGAAGGIASRKRKEAAVASPNQNTSKRAGRLTPPAALRKRRVEGTSAAATMSKKNADSIGVVAVPSMRRAPKRAKQDSGELSDQLPQPASTVDIVDRPFSTRGSSSTRPASGATGSLSLHESTQQLLNDIWDANAGLVETLKRQMDALMRAHLLEVEATMDRRVERALGAREKSRESLANREHVDLANVHLSTAEKCLSRVLNNQKWEKEEETMLQTATDACQNAQAALRQMQWM